MLLNQFYSFHFLFVPIKPNNFYLLFTDNGDNLTMEEKKFVDDPKNAHLFPDPPSCEKRCGQETTSNPPKRIKTSDDEVSAKS